MVVGVLALASALVRDREDALRAWTGRAQDSQSIVSPRVEDEEEGGDAITGSADDANRATSAGEVKATTVATAGEVSPRAPHDNATETASEVSTDAPAD